jgi:hypothetical protein
VRGPFGASIPPSTRVRLAYLRIGSWGIPLPLYCIGTNPRGLAVQPIWPLHFLWGTAVIPWTRVIDVSANLGLNRGPYWLKLEGGPKLGLDAGHFDSLRSVLKGAGVPGSY